MEEPTLPTQQSVSKGDFNMKLSLMEKVYSLLLVTNKQLLYCFKIYSCVFYQVIIHQIIFLDYLTNYFVSHLYAVAQAAEGSEVPWQFFLFCLKMSPFHITTGGK